MDGRSQPAVSYKILLCSIGAFAWFGLSFANLSFALWSDAPVVTLSKGAMYLLGVGVAGGALTVAIFRGGHRGSCAHR